MIDFSSNDTELLLNPRLPEEEKSSAKNIVSSSKAPSGLVWLLTSGSSGEKKLVGLGRDALLESARAVNDHLGANDSDRWLLALPGFHVGGLGIVARAHLSDSPVHTPFIGERWLVGKFLEAVKEDRSTLSALVPAQVFDLVESHQECPDTLRAIVVGGGALDPSLYSRARTLKYPLLPSYGLTECCSQVATASILSLESEQYPPLSCLDHVKIDVSSEGLLCIKSKSLLEGYLFEREGEIFFEDPKRDGWFETDDRGCLEGREVTVFGRDEKFLKVGGENVDLNRLDNQLAQLLNDHVQGTDAALSSVPDKRLAHRIVLVVERKYGIDIADHIKDLFNAQVAPFERIRGIALVDRLVRTSLGKLSKIDVTDLDII